MKQIYFRYTSDVNIFVLLNTLMAVLCYSSLILYQSGAPLIKCSYFYLDDNQMPVPVAARSKVWVCGRSLAGIVGSNPTGGMDVCCECCVLSGRGLYDELINSLEESSRLWGVVVCDLETS